MSEGVSDMAYVPGTAAEYFQEFIAGEITMEKFYIPHGNFLDDFYHADDNIERKRLAAVYEINNFSPISSLADPCNP
jgi:hypothetical protein